MPQEDGICQYGMRAFGRCTEYAIRERHKACFCWYNKGLRSCNTVDQENDLRSIDESGRISDQRYVSPV